MYRRHALGLERAPAYASVMTAGIVKKTIVGHRYSAGMHKNKVGRKYCIILIWVRTGCLQARLLPAIL